MDKKYGYVYIHTYKPFYFPGEIVRGSVIMDLFNDLPKQHKKVKISFLGREMVGKHYSKVDAVLKRQ